MINRVFTRVNGSAGWTDQWDVTIADAFKELVECELNFGGRFIELDETHIAIQTKIFSCVDTTTYTGSGDAFDRMTKLCAFYTAVAKYNYDPEGGLGAMVEKVMEVTKGLPLYITSMSDMLIGESTTRAAMGVYLAVECDLDPELIKQQDGKGIYALCRMAVVEGATKEQLIEAAEKIPHVVVA